MHKEFWLDRWKNRQIGFDQPSPNHLLIKHFNKLNLSNRDKVFVPLTGKSVDVLWLLSEGYQIVGCELSEQAVIELYTSLNSVATKTHWEHGLIYRSDDLAMYVGDFFDLQIADLGEIHGVYDRASKVALPPEMRSRYTEHLATITQKAPQLLIVFEYDQELVSGPPFSIAEKEIRSHYDKFYDISLLERTKLPYGIKGIAPTTENAWLLKSK